MNAHNPVAANAMLTRALQYAERGWPVFPCSAETKRPLTEHGCLDASADPDTIARWWARFPTAMIGCATGPRSGFWVLDLDRDDSGKDGAAAFARMSDLPETVEQTTPRGGQHKFFRWDDGRPVRNSVSRLAPGVDTRGDGGYVILAGSIRSDGALYQWAISPQNGEIADAPDWLYEDLRRLRIEAAARTPTDPEALRGTIGRVRRALELTPNDYRDRDTYVNVLTAAKGALPDDLDAAWDMAWTWCRKWTGGVNEEGVVRRDFDSLKPESLGIGFLERMANRRSDGRLMAETHHERIKPNGIDPTPYAFPEPSSIPPRASLYAGHYIRKFLSATIAQSKVGKSTLVLAEALAMASGKPLLGIEPAGKLRVWWWNGEDPHEELERRVAAAMKFYGLTREDIEDRLLINSGREMPIVLASQGKNGSAVIDKAVVDAMCEAILRNKIDVTIADPFISLHRVSENDNNAIDAVAKTGALIAERTNSSLEAVHHSRKLNGTDAVVEDGRGASALLGATRSMRALSKMSKTDATQRGIGLEHRTLFRFSDVSSNMSPPSAEEDEKWMQIVSVNLENGAGDALDRVMKGDRVGVAKVWGVAETRAKALAASIPATEEERALAAIAANEWRRDARAANWAGVPIAQEMGFDLDTPEGKSAAKNVLKLWLDQGKLAEENRPDRYRNTRTYVVRTLPMASDDLFG